MPLREMMRAHASLMAKKLKSQRESEFDFAGGAAASSWLYAETQRGGEQRSLEGNAGLGCSRRWGFWHSRDYASVLCFTLS